MVSTDDDLGARLDGNLRMRGNILGTSHASLIEPRELITVERNKNPTQIRHSP